MTDTSSIELLGAASENGVVADLARRAVAPAQITIIENRLAGVVVDGKLITFELDKYADHPRRAEGRVSLNDPDSFIAYVNRHRDEAATTLWTDVNAGTVTAVFDDHAKDAGDPGFGRHRAILQLQNTPEWTHWIDGSGTPMSQQEFAEHIEDGTVSIFEPDAATMLELAQSFQAATSVDFKSGTRLSSGETQLRYEEKVDAQAGPSGSITIPNTIKLRLGVFVGGGLPREQEATDGDGQPALYELTARFFYRIGGGKLAMGYKLIRPDVARQLAFDDLTSTISEGVNLDVLAGTPRA